MDPLKAVVNEAQELQGAVSSLNAALSEIEQRLLSACERSQEMISGVLSALAGNLQAVPQQREALGGVAFEIDQARGRIKELTTRSKAVGVLEALTGEKKRLSLLQHTCRDLQSDLEAFKHFRMNFEGRLSRLKGG